MSELVKQLREYGAAFDDGPGMFKDAADRIEALEAENARLRRELEETIAYWSTRGELP